MITDYKNIVLIIIPVLLGFHFFVRNCELKPHIASLIIFVLLTLPCLVILGTILYYHFSKVQPYNNKDDCMKYNYEQYGQGLCNVWNEDEKKCYKGLYDDKNNVCNSDMIKNIPSSVYVGSAIIILANIFIHKYSSNCY